MSDSSKKGKDKNSIITYIHKNKKAVIRNAIIAVAVIFVLICVANTLGLFSGKKAQLTTIAESSLEDIVEISDLSTLKYNYNSIAKVSDDKGNEKYYVAYEGVVKLGINFSEAEPKIDMKEKKIIVTLPKVEVQEVTVDMKSLDFIFKKQKYETETILSDAYSECLKDLSNKANKDDSLYDMAKENAESTIRALMEPLIQELDSEFTVEVK